MPGIAGASRWGAAMARRKRRGNGSARNMDRWRERSSRHRDQCAVRIPETGGARAWPSPAARAVRACLAPDAAGAWIVLRTAFSFPVPLGYWLEGGGRTRGGAGPAPSRRRFSRTAVCAGEGRTLGSGSHERAGAFDGSGANGRTAAGCGERAPCCPHPVRPARAAHDARGCAPANPSVRPSSCTVCAGGPTQSGRNARGPYLDRVWERGIVGLHGTTRRQRDGLHRQRAARSGRGSAHGERRAGRDGGVCVAAWRRRRRLVGRAGRSERAGPGNARKSNRLVPLSSDSGPGRTAPFDSR